MRAPLIRTTNCAKQVSIPWINCLLLLSLPLVYAQAQTYITLALLSVHFPSNSPVEGCCKNTNELTSIIGGVHAPNICKGAHFHQCWGALRSCHHCYTAASLTMSDTCAKDQDEQLHIEPICHVQSGGCAGETDPWCTRSLTPFVAAEVNTLGQRIHHLLCVSRQISEKKTSFVNTLFAGSNQWISKTLAQMPQDGSQQRKNQGNPLSEICPDMVEPRA